MSAADDALDVVVVGAGFAGLYALHKFRQQGYSFSDELQQEWTWTQKYAAQPEILAYLNWAADKLDLRRDIMFSTRVSSAVLDETTLRWSVTTGRPSRLGSS